MSDVSDMASSDGHPSRGVTPSAPKQQETPSIGCACPTSRTWPPSTAVAQRWGNGPLIAFKHRIQASHSSIAFKHRIQLSHSQISDTTDAALFRGDQRPTGGCAIRRPLQSPQMIIGPVKGGGCGRGGGSEYTGMPIRVISRTNQRNRGRTSADRSTKATLMLTVPRSLIKSSTKDLT